MKSVLITPTAASFDSMGGHDPLAGRALTFVAVLCLHAALIVWILHVRKDAPEEIEPIRVSVRLVEAAAPAPPSLAPEPVNESPQPSPQVIRSAIPVKPPVRNVIRKVAPQPRMITPPQEPVAESSIRTPIAPPSVIAVRYDADYLNNPAPVYPMLSRRKGEQGKVLLLVQVSAQGLAEKVEIRTGSGYPRLDSAALMAVKGWRFVPARRGDEVIAASVVVPIVFRLGD